MTPLPLLPSPLPANALQPTHRSGSDPWTPSSWVLFSFRPGVSPKGQGPCAPTPGPAHRPGTRSASTGASQRAVMGQPGLARPLASFSVPVQTGPEPPAPHSRAPPGAPGGQQPHPALCPLCSDLHKVRASGSACVGGLGYMTAPSSPAHTEDSAGCGATVPLTLCPLLPSRARAHTHSESPEAAERSTCAGVWSTERCHLCHRAC